MRVDFFGYPLPSPFSKAAHPHPHPSQGYGFNPRNPHETPKEIEDSERDRPSRSVGEVPGGCPVPAEAVGTNKTLHDPLWGGASRHPCLTLTLTLTLTLRDLAYPSPSPFPIFGRVEGTTLALVWPWVYGCELCPRGRGKKLGKKQGMKHK